MEQIESDVVVIGYGAAGATSAIAAHDSGASVVILEKMPAGGGNSLVSAGNFVIPRSMEFTEYLNTLSYGTTEPEITEAYVREAMKTGEWIREIGGEVIAFGSRGGTSSSLVTTASFPNVPGAEFMDKFNIKEPAAGPAQVRLWNLLTSNIERRGIKVLTNTPASELITNTEGEITGVIAEQSGKTIQIDARKAVILTCGGFENNEALKWDNLPCKPIKFLGSPGNTGDGIKMAEKVGAALWHMTGLSCLIGFQSPEHEAAFAVIIRNPGFIYVDKSGRRFVNETGVEVHEYWRELALFDPEHVEYPRIPFYAIFDEENRLKAPLGIPTGYQRNVYRWSADNSAEIDKGWITRADTIEELAGKISIDGSNLSDTLRRYHDFCQTGEDTDFNRTGDRLKAIDTPPYYAIQLHPALINTQGGPRRDKESRVLDAYGKPIPRLYAAGELGSIWGFLYQGGNNLGECLVFGRIAGRNAAAEKSVS